MRRFFAFGCSFTRYHWSTWADCLAPEFDWWENWGCPGAGNHYIFNAVMEADQKYRFGADDTVVVCWTNIYREDRYRRGQWIQLDYTDAAIKTFVNRYIDLRGCLIRDLAMIKACHDLLANRSGVIWRSLSMCDITKRDLWDDEDIPDQDVITHYRDVVDQMLPSYRRVLRPMGWGGPYSGWIHKERFGDPHPWPREHLAYIDTVLPGWITRTSTREAIQNEMTWVSQGEIRHQTKPGPWALPRL